VAFHFGDLLGRGQPALLGIDIGAAAIRLVELGRAGSRLRVEHYAMERLPPEALRDGTVLQFDQVADALRRALKHSGTRTRCAAFALPHGAVITKTLTVPDDLSPHDLETQVEIEASQSLPFALDEISLDFGILGPAENTPHTIQILLAAARKEKIEERLALAEAAGIRPVAMDIESHAARFALARCMAEEGERVQRHVALFQVGPEVSSLSVLDGATLLYEREQAFGAQKLEHDLALVPASAPLPPTLQAALVAFAESAAQELTRALQLFFTSTSHTSIDHVYLAANGPIALALLDMVAKRGLPPVSLADCFHGMARSSLPAQQHIDASGCLVACGLALRRFA